MKVHFAGLEQKDYAVILNKVAGINCRLFTVFPFIAKQFGIKPMILTSTLPDVGDFLTKNMNHCIMDSGLFTLMFGAHAGKRDEKFVRAWQEAIIKFVKTTGYKGTVVEVDCQKILGVEMAWELRKQLRKALPNNQQINVFHIEDGEEGLKKMARWSKYIALSIPEFRSLKWKNLPLKVNQLCNIIKKENPGIKIHLLGCTQKNIMQNCKFCDSSDSTSWQQVNRFGTGLIYNNNQYKKIKRSLVEDQSGSINKEVDRYFKENKITPTGSNLTYYSNFALTGIYLKQMYSIYAGSQE